MYQDYSDWQERRNLPVEFAAMGMLIMFGGLAVQSTSREIVSLALADTMSIFGAFFIFAAMLKVRIAPYSSRAGSRQTRITLSSIPESLLVTSILYGVGNVSIYLMQFYSFVGVDVWTLLTTPVILLGYLLFEGSLAVTSFLLRPIH